VHLEYEAGNILIGNLEPGVLEVHVTGFGIARSMASVSNTSSIILNLTETKKVVESRRT
jgi:hypothetical protein